MKLKLLCVLLLFSGCMNEEIGIMPGNTEQDTAITVNSYTQSRCQVGSTRCDIIPAQDTLSTGTNSLMIGVSYSRKDYREWGWKQEGDGLPLYLRWPYTQIWVQYSLSPAIRAALPPDSNVELRGYLFYEDEGILFHHKWTIDKRTRLLFYTADRDWFNAKADYIKIIIHHTRQGITGEIGSCDVQIPKYECTQNYEIPWTDMCEYKNVDLSCEMIFTKY